MLKSLDDVPYEIASRRAPFCFRGRCVDWEKQVQQWLLVTIDGVVGGIQSPVSVVKQSYIVEGPSWLFLSVNVPYSPCLPDKCRETARVGSLS